MKKILSTALFCFYAVIANCQITLEKSYNESISLTRISENEYYYVGIDLNANTIKLYTLSHQLEKTIAIPVKPGLKLSGIKYLSRDLFNLDNNIEYMVLYLNSESKHKNFVLDETGNQLFEEELDYYSLGVQNTKSNGTKLFTAQFEYDPANQTTNEKTKVYALPGRLASLGKRAVQDEDTDLAAYPNPAAGFINIGIKLPDNTLDGKLIITDISGRVVEKIAIPNGKSLHLLNTSNYTPGIYIYYTETSAGISAISRFIVQ